jgi:SAM-dependent methyltransferase
MHSRKKQKRHDKNKRERRGKRKKLTAATADPHWLYQQAVQDPATEIQFITRTFRKLRQREPESLREDFCGTALFCAEWVKSSTRSVRTATGVDIDPSVLSWGRKHNLEPLGELARRVRLLQQDVRDPSPEKYDVVIAFNFSYWVFRTRQAQRTYFETVRRSLERDGVFFIDVYGGWEAHKPMLERRKIGHGVTYTWDQDVICPITNSIVNHIHFEFKDGTELEKAFTYEWRLWSLPELCELLDEAGFPDVRVYWDVAEGDDEVEYRPRTHARSQPGWLAYIAACR